METLLRTKFFPPSLPIRIVSRPELIRRLNELRPLTLISAPPGFGKSTLIAEWRKDNDLELAWLSLDEDDDNVPRFLSYFIAALQTVRPQIGAGSAFLLQSTSDYKTILPPLLNDLNKLDSNLLVVLDDYHVLRADAIHEMLTYILEHQPAPLRLLIITRRDPPLPLARLRGRGQLTELRADDLRFTKEDTASFLNQMMGLSLSDSEVSALEQHTEGWIAGLQMAASYMQSKIDLHQFVSTFTGGHPAIGDYLMEEVFRRQSDAVQSFLLQTSILDRFCARLCDAVIQSQASLRILDQLSRSNIFLISLDNRREWYRYHHLFSEFLRGRVKDANELHRRASEWFEKNGYLPEAIKHAIAAGADKIALRLLKGHAPNMLARGDPTSFLLLVESLPVQIRNTDARLLLYIVIARFLLGDEEGVEQAFHDVKTSLRDVPDEDMQTIRAELEAVKLSISVERGAGPEHIEKAGRLLENIPGENAFLRASLFFALGDAYYSAGDVRSAIHAFRESKQIAEANQNPLLTLASVYELAELHIEQGQLGRSKTFLQRAIKAIEAHAGEGTRISALGGAYIGLGKIHYLRNELAQARRLLEKGIDMAKQPGGLGLARRGLLILAFVAQAEGKDEEASQWLQQAEKRTRISPRRDAMPRLMPEKVRFWLLQGNLAAARRWARETEKQADPTARERIAIARVQLVQKEARELGTVLKWLSDLRAEIEAQGRNGLLIQMLILESLVHHAQRNTDRALRALAECLALAEPENYVRAFLEEGRPMRELLAMALHEGIAPEYVRKLIEAFEQPGRRSQPLIEPLSRRELEVLGLLVEGASNAEIAEELVIAVGTVKRHTLRIYQKLGVSSRTQAVARAHELNLL